MIGQLTWGKQKKVRGERAELYGLPVLRVQLDPEGWLGPRRLRRAGAVLHRGGVMRTLIPRDFENWGTLRDCGLKKIDPIGFIRAQSELLTLSAVEKQGVALDRAVITLRGPRTDWELTRTALALCPKVRYLTIDAARGGEELANRLRWEFGMPLYPREERPTVAVSFGPVEERPAGMNLHLYGDSPDLAGLSIKAPALSQEDQFDLPLLTVLWEEGRLASENIRIT